MYQFLLISLLLIPAYCQFPQLSPQVVAAIQSRADYCIGQNLPSSPEVDMIRKKILECNEIMCGQALVARVVQMYPNQISAIRDCFRAGGF